MATELSSTVACGVGVEEDRLDGLPGCSRRCLGHPHFLLELRLKSPRRAGAPGRACGQRSSAHWSPVPSAYLGTSRALVETQGPGMARKVCAGMKPQLWSWLITTLKNRDPFLGFPETLGPSPAEAQDREGLLPRTPVQRPGHFTGGSESFGENPIVRNTADLHLKGQAGGGREGPWTLWIPLAGPMGRKLQGCKHYLPFFPSLWRWERGGENLRLHSWCTAQPEA